MTITAHFDGKVIVPDEPLDVPTGQRFIVDLQPYSQKPTAIPASALMEIVGTLSKEESAEMQQIVTEGRQIDHADW